MNLVSFVRMPRNPVKLPILREVLVLPHDLAPATIERIKFI